MGIKSSSTKTVKVLRKDARGNVFKFGIVHHDEIDDFLIILKTAFSGNTK